MPGASRTEDPYARLESNAIDPVNKVVIINREIMPGRITVVLVDEVLGF
jgi:hypothetical protein